MTVKKATYTLWSGTNLLDTRPHLTEDYMDLLEKAYDLQQGAGWLGHITIYSSNEEDGPVYSSKVDPAPKETPTTAGPNPDPAYDGWGGCWAGDGSGMDDLADYNAMEGADY